MLLLSASLTEVHFQRAPFLARYLACFPVSGGGGSSPISWLSCQSFASLLLFPFPVSLAV